MKFFTFIKLSFTFKIALAPPTPLWGVKAAPKGGKGPAGFVPPSNPLP